MSLRYLLRTGPAKIIFSTTATFASGQFSVHRSHRYEN